MQNQEYRRLQKILPSVSSVKTVKKVKVVEEAIRYIDELHEALALKIHSSGIQLHTPQHAAVFNFIQHMAAENLKSKQSTLLHMKPCSKKQLCYENTALSFNPSIQSSNLFPSDLSHSSNQNLSVKRSEVLNNTNHCS